MGTNDSQSPLSITNKTMRKTEKKYWVNGYKTMGVNFHTLAFQFLGLGILICWRLKPNAFTNKRYFNFEMFNLIK